MTLIINIFLIPIYGYLGSAIATLIAYLTMAILSYLIGKKYYPIPYNISNILFYIFLAIFLSTISFYFFRYNLLVGILCILIMNLVILIKEKKRIFNFIKLVK